MIHCLNYLCMVKLVVGCGYLCLQLQKLPLQRSHALPVSRMVADSCSHLQKCLLFAQLALTQRPLYY